MDVSKITEGKIRPETAQSYDVPGEASRRQRSRWRRQLLGVGIAILTDIVVLIWGLWQYPQTLPEPLPELAATTSALSLFLIVAAAVAVPLAALYDRTRPTQEAQHG